ncbi:hypothetical protein AEAC466_19010 [Asticcacaulis sp. AC466]|uniref:response regulator n=1 Tax=Asticcacaulis sp. AC466 TaxID=1282362 RepID=UPI0003C3AF92|nr:response regulator [Asticcacaulis sp. AC466]ESQ82009.1 hypothetical protein AEAC466_19010 [Asticcacaulis sp. AC466]
MSTISERTDLPRVLLVEDTAGEATLMKLAFRRSELPSQVIVATSAELALSMLKREGKYEALDLPDLILTDLNLPRMSGLHLLKQVKADPTLRNIPIVILSTTGEMEDLQTAYKDCANGYVIKPISLDDYDNLIGVIQDYWFGLVQTIPTDTGPTDTGLIESEDAPPHRRAAQA